MYTCIYVIYICVYIYIHIQINIVLIYAVFIIISSWYLHILNSTYKAMIRIERITPIKVTISRNSSTVVVQKVSFPMAHSLNNFSFYQVH